MKDILKKISTPQKLWILVPLIVLITSMTGCVAVMPGYDHTVTYDNYDVNSDCQITNKNNTATETSRSGWFSDLEFDQNWFWPFPFQFMFCNPNFEGHLHLPFVGPDCSWYNSHDSCQNILPFTGKISGTTITINIDYTRGDTRFVGHIYLTAVIQLPVVGGFINLWVSNVSLKPNPQSYINKYVNNECTKKIIFTAYSGTYVDGKSVAQLETLIEEQGIELPLDMDLSQIVITE